MIIDIIVKWIVGLDFGEECPVDLVSRVKWLVAAIMAASIVTLLIFEIIVVFAWNLYNENAFEVATSEYRMVLAVRVDLLMPIWTTVTQCTTATIGASDIAMKFFEYERLQWLGQTQKQTVIHIYSDAQLNEFKEECRRSNINYFICQYNHQSTVIAMGPARSADLEILLRNFVQY